VDVSASVNTPDCVCCNSDDYRAVRSVVRESALPPKPVLTPKDFMSTAQIEIVH
jgi:hypothetical protein